MNIREVVLECYNNPFIQQLFKMMEEYKDTLISNWKSLAKMYSPSGGEINRAKFILEKFWEFGIKKSYIDDSGNVIGILEGKEEGPNLAYIGTMDDLKTIAERVKDWDKPLIVKNNKIIGPGTFITGTCVSIIGLVKIFSLPEIEFNGKIYFVAVAKEEQNLLGMKDFIKDQGKELDYIIDVMGGVGRMYYGALGILMLKVHFKGPKGHTLSGGLPNVTRGIARAIDEIYSIPLPSEPTANETVDFGIGKVNLKGHYLNITMLQASDVINHKSDNGWFSIDLRSINNEVIESVKAKIFVIVERIAKEEELKSHIEIISDTPAGQLPEARDSRIVKISEEGMKLFSENIFISNMGSTNMNVGILNKIPSIMIAGKEGGNRDTPEEYGNIEYIIKGIKLNFLIGFIITSGTLK